MRRGERGGSATLGTRACQPGVTNFRCSEVGVSGLPLLPGGDVPVSESVGS